MLQGIFFVGRVILLKAILRLKVVKLCRRLIKSAAKTLRRETGEGFSVLNEFIHRVNECQTDCH